MSTYAEMIARIADDLDRTDVNTQIGLAINRAIEYYAKKHRFWFNEATATFNTVASQFNYTSTDTGISTLREIDYVKIAISASNNYELVPITYKQIQDDNVSATTGQPSEYAYYKENFYLYEIPDAVYTITVSYVKSYATLTGSSSNDFTTNAEDLIESRATWWLAKRILHDEELARSAKESEMDSLEALKTETNRIKQTGRLDPTEF